MLKAQSLKWYYVGSTNDIPRRLREHSQGKVSSTKSKLPISLVYKKAFEDESSARQYEKRLKSRRIEKEALIEYVEKNCGIV